MEAPQPQQDAHVLHLNELRRGEVFHAATHAGITIGEYLGMEAGHGERAILLRNETGTASIAVDAITSIRPAA